MNNHEYIGIVIRSLRSSRYCQIWK